MVSGRAVCDLLRTATGVAAAGVLLSLLAAPVHARDAADSPIDTDNPRLATLLSWPFVATSNWRLPRLSAPSWWDLRRPGRGDAAATAGFLAIPGLDVDEPPLSRTARTIGWLAEGAAPVGRLAEFFIGGGDSGWHFSLTPVGDDEYMLEWQFKFR